MELPGRRSSYSLISQYPDDPPPKFDSPPTSSSHSQSQSRSSIKPHHLFDNFPQIFPLQRQSSGSSFGESSLSGGAADYYLPATLSSITPSIDIDPDGCNPVGPAPVVSEMVAATAAPSAASSSSMKSWAQQAEEAYQMQLALALRLCSDAACANDPNFLEAGDQHGLPPPAPAGGERGGMEALSHRFWVWFSTYSIYLSTFNSVSIFI